MSLNKRRWSNEFLDSLIDFQSRENSDSTNKTILFDSLESKRIEASVDSLDNRCTEFTSILDTQNDLITFVTSQEAIKESSIHNLKISDSDNKLNTSRSYNNVINLSLTENDNISKEDLNSTLLMDNIVNINPSITENDVPNTGEHLKIVSSHVDHLFNLNERLKENISSDIETIKESSYESDNHTIVESKSIKNHYIENSTTVCEELVLLDDRFNEKTMKNIMISNSGTIKMSSCDSSIQNIIQTKSTEHQINKSLMYIPRQDKLKQRFFSSPLEFPPSDQEMITEMNKPDIWDTLLALEQALSPVEENAQSVEECSQEYPHILSRLSQKFRKTPTRFTEKLVSIIEDSVVSSESPTKQYSGNNSGISLHRMTGEFRKLCKFIEDESMPEWAPSLMNMTGSCFENIKTPEYEVKKNTNFNATPKTTSRFINDTPSRRITPKALKCLLTPKNKIISNVNSPVNQFTPTADKSFEYWERVCNMMCDNKASTKENTRNSLYMPESSKLSMNEMLTICERQMASLDDSTIDIRSSEPNKKTDNDLKLKVVQAPRSKSESKIIFNTNEKKKRTLKKHEDEKKNKKVIFDDYELTNEYENMKLNNKLIFKDDSKSQINKDLEQITTKCQEDFETLDNKDFRENNQEMFENDFELLLYSPEKKQKEEITQDSYNDNEQDCSLLIELAKRRQRCLDTAKLMLEIDKEDPITNEDSKCLETLYKLGIQDKSFVEVEDDTKFLNTLSQCIDYKNYINVKSKPFLNILNELNSPDDLKNKATSIIRSKQLLSHLNCKTKSHQKSTLMKSRSELKNGLKNIQDKKITSRLIPKPISKIIPKVEKKTSCLSDFQQKKETPRVDKTVSHCLNLQKNKVTPRTISKMPTKTIPQVDKNSLQTEILEKKVTKKIINKPSIKVSECDQRSHIQGKKLTPKVVPTTSLKTTPQLDQQKLTLKATPKFFALKTPSNVVVDNHTNGSSILRENHQNVTPQSPKARLFLTPGKCSKGVTSGRKKPPSYFLDGVSKKLTPLKTDYNNIKSPISLYIHGTDTDLIQNVHGKINDRLLTPVSSGNAGKSPKLKFTLSSKENKSPTSNCNENIILPTVRYQPAKKVHLIDDKASYSPSSLTPNSKTKKLLGPIENTVVIRHEGRVIDYNPKSDYVNSETSIRFQKMAEKTISLRKKCL